MLDDSSSDFLTGFQQLLYVDGLLISIKSVKELFVKLKTWKSEMEKKGLQVNIEKTKIMMSGINLDMLKTSGKVPCGVCLTGVGSKSIFCSGCLCLYTRNAVALRAPCTLTLASVCPTPGNGTAY